MELLTEEVGLMRKQNLSAFDLAKIEALGGDFFRCDHHWIGVGLHELFELLAGGDDLLERVLFLRLERKCGDLHLPVLQIFQLRTRRITRDLHPPVTDGAGVFVIFLELTASNLQAFTVVPANPVSLCI